MRYFRGSVATIEKNVSRNKDTIWTNHNIEYWCKLPAFDKEK